MTSRAPAISPGDIDVTSVSKSYGSVPILEAVDLSVTSGELVALVGPSGCGKSTLLRIIAGLVEPTTGGVSIGGDNPGVARANHRVAIAFQHAGLLEWRDVGANVDLPLRIAGWAAEERRERVAELLRLVGLDDVSTHNVWELSGGMQQRVALARALAARPAVLLLDEPFAALDEMTRERLQDELLALQLTTGVTVVLVTHSISEAAYLADRVVVLSPRPGHILGLVTTANGDDRAPRSDASYGTTAAEIRSIITGSEFVRHT